MNSENINFDNFNEVFEMNDFRRDVFIGLMFITGIFGFISGEFVISTLFFASAAIYSNIAMSQPRSESKI